VPASARPEGLVLETERLFLREFEASDVDALAEILGDPETMRYYPHPKSNDETRDWIEWSRASYREHGFGKWATIEKESGDLIGSIGLVMQDVDGDHLVEVGYILKRTRWHRGLATEAAAACRDHAFAVAGVDRLIALIRPENEPSWRLAERLGMHLWRHTERSGFGHRVYAMTREEWRETLAEPAFSPHP
jgi:RimJ/RimL family protein N-acetyltransferase